MEKYYHQIEVEKNKIYQKNNYKKEDLRFFFLTSANLYNLMPNIPMSEHESFYKNILFHHTLAWIEQIHWPIIDKCKIEGLSVDTIELPVIFCAFHLSSYRLNLIYLVNKGVPISLVASENVIKEQGTQIKSFYKEITGKDDFSIINSESPTSLFQMIKEIKNGKSLFIYIDGNSGVGGMKRDLSGLIKIDFLNKNLNARKGVAFLSHYLRIPIIPMLVYRNSIEDIHIRIFDPIRPEGSDRESYCTEATTFLYNNFSSWLLKYPDQWEAWFYLHKYLDVRSIAQSHIDPPEQLIDSQNLRFNVMRYGFFFLKKGIFLFDRYTYRSYPIEKKTFDLLQDDSLLKKIDPNDYLDFIKKKVII